MPPFPERESSILAKLKKKKPNSVKEKDEKPEAEKPTSNGQVPTVEKVSTVLLVIVGLKFVYYFCGFKCECVYL